LSNILDLTSSFRTKNSHSKGQTKLYYQEFHISVLGKETRKQINKFGLNGRQIIGAVRGRECTVWEPHKH
jgi:hypothetical protein